MERDLIAFQQTGVLASGLTYSFTITGVMNKCKIGDIKMHFSGGVTGNIQIIYDSVLGAAYDTVLKTFVLSADTDVLYAPEGRAIFRVGDILKITVPTASGVTYGLSGNMIQM